MKWLAWIAGLLLMANGALYGYMQLNDSRHGETLVGHEPLHGDKIKIATAADVMKPETPKEADTDSGKAPICMDWSGIASGDMDRSRNELEKLGLADRMTALVTPTSYWVFIPPLNTMKDAEKKLSEVKKLGIEDNVRIEDEGKWKFAVNLGMFATEEEAKKYFEQLKGKGVKSAKTGRRDGANEIVGWHIQNVDEVLATKLGQLQSGFSGSNLKPSECNE